MEVVVSSLDLMDMEIGKVTISQPFLWVTLQVMLHSLHIFSGRVSWHSCLIRIVC